MRRILAVFISFLIFFALSGCGSKTSNDAKAKDDLYVKAIEILNELSEDERVSDFLYAYDFFYQKKKIFRLIIKSKVRIILTVLPMIL